MLPQSETRDSPIRNPQSEIRNSSSPNPLQSEIANPKSEIIRAQHAARLRPGRLFNPKSTTRYPKFVFTQYSSIRNRKSEFRNRSRAARCAPTSWQARCPGLILTSATAIASHSQEWGKQISPLRATTGMAGGIRLNSRQSWTPLFYFCVTRISENWHDNCLVICNISVHHCGAIGQGSDAVFALDK